MSQDICSQCTGCSEMGLVCGGQAGCFYPELCPSHEYYIGNRRWE